MTTTKGSVLLEAVVALAILGLGGIGVLMSMGQVVDSTERAARAAVTMENADRVLAAMSLLTRRELDRRLGSREIGDFLVVVNRPEGELYRIAIASRDRPDADLLVTVVHRARGRFQ